MAAHKRGAIRHFCYGNRDDPFISVTSHAGDGISALAREVIDTAVGRRAGEKPKVTPSPPAATFPAAPRPASGRVR